MVTRKSILKDLSTAKEQFESCPKFRGKVIKGFHQILLFRVYLIVSYTLLSS